MFSVYYRRHGRQYDCLFVVRVPDASTAHSIVLALLDDFGDEVAEAWCEAD